jgi:hypothetical protein
MEASNRTENRKQQKQTKARHTQGATDGGASTTNANVADDLDQVVQRYSNEQNQ